MLSNKSGAIAGAAMLGTAALLGTNAASAFIDLYEDDKSGAAVTFAKETIVTSVTGEDGAKYYMVDGGTHELNVKAKVDFGGPGGSVLTIKYTFDGMILTENSAPVLHVGGSDTNCGATTGLDSNATMRGRTDTTVSFIYPRVANSTDGADAVLCLQLEEAAIAMGGASVTMKVSDDLAIPESREESYSNAVRIKSALDETANGKDLEATVASGFKLFDTTLGTIGDIGSFMAGVHTSFKSAADGDDTVVATHLYSDSGSSVEISGDFSFATKVTMRDDACASDSSDGNLLQDDTHADRDKKLKSQTLAFVTGKNLCITVADSDSESAVAIPETAPYKVMVTYKGAVVTDTDGNNVNPMFPTMGMEQELGSISRGGTHVHIPYLTTYAGYKQLLIITNRGGDVNYSISFTAEDGVTATAKAGMERGMLKAGETKVMKVSDVVTITGGARTSASLFIEAENADINVATNQVNLSDGSSDTVNYNN